VSALTEQERERAAALAEVRAALLTTLAFIDKGLDGAHQALDGLIRLADIAVTEGDTGRLIAQALDNARLMIAAARQYAPTADQ